MRKMIKKLIDATCVIDKTYFVKGRSMAVKPNIVILMSAMDNDENLSQSKLHTDWLLPLSTINTITTECRSEGWITLEPIPGKRRECYLRFTEKGRRFADELLAGIHHAEETALQETLKHYSPEFVEALEFYAKHFHAAVNQESSHE